MKKHNHIEYEVHCAGITQAQKGIESAEGDLAWRIHLSFCMYPEGNKFTNQVFIGNEEGWFVEGSEEMNALSRELIQLLEHIATQEALHMLTP
jgi:hypothetical protein